jgi:hypothetical protein
MSEDQLMKMFKYMQREFTAVRSEISGVNTNINIYANSVDGFAKQSETYMQEMLALGHKVDRLEQWILKVAKPAGIKLTA